MTARGFNLHGNDKREYPLNELLARNLLTVRIYISCGRTSTGARIETLCFARSKSDSDELSLPTNPSDSNIFDKSNTGILQ